MDFPRPQANYEYATDGRQLGRIIRKPGSAHKRHRYRLIRGGETVSLHRKKQAGGKKRGAKGSRRVRRVS